jgi:hypothetical protein
MYSGIHIVNNTYELHPKKKNDLLNSMVHSFIVILWLNLLILGTKLATWIGVVRFNDAMHWTHKISKLKSYLQYFYQEPRWINYAFWAWNMKK